MDASLAAVLPVLCNYLDPWDMACVRGTSRGLKDAVDHCFWSNPSLSRTIPQDERFLKSPAMFEWAYRSVMPSALGVAVSLAYQRDTELPIQFPLSEYEFTFARACRTADTGDLETLSKLCDEGMPLHPEFTRVASLSDKKEILKHLADRGCPWDDEVALYVVERGDWETANWLFRQGCPFDDQAIDSLNRMGCEFCPDSGIYLW